MLRIPCSTACLIVTLSCVLPTHVSAQNAPASPPGRVRHDTAHAKAIDNAALLRTQVEDLELDDSTRELIAGLRLRPVTVGTGAIQIVLRFRSNVSIAVPVAPAAFPTLDVARARLADGVVATTRRFRLVARGDSTIHSLEDLHEYLGEVRAIGPLLLDSISNHGLGAQAIETALHGSTLHDIVCSLSAKPERLLVLEADATQVDEGLGARVLFRLLIEQGRVDPDSLFARRDTAGRAAQIDALARSTEGGDRDRRQLIALWVTALHEQTGDRVGATQSGSPKDSTARRDTTVSVRLAGAIPLAPGFTIDDIYRVRSLPNWLDFARAFTSNMPVWTTRWEKEGTLLKADPAAGAAASLSVRSESSPRSPEMELSAPLNRSIAVVTGTYSTGKSRVVGLTYTGGKLVGGLIQPWDGLCFIAPSGRLFIAQLSAVDLGAVATALQLQLTDEDRHRAPLSPIDNGSDLPTLIRFVEHYQLTMFQSHLLLFGGRPQVSQRPPATGRRLLVSFADGRFGILTLGGSSINALGFTLGEAAAIAERIGAVSAVNLDTGAWNKGWIEAGGQRVSIGDGTASLAQLSNVLRVFQHATPGSR